MIELLRDDEGQPWFMELNGRAWGSMALACRRGFAYPAWAVRAALDTGTCPRSRLTRRTSPPAIWAARSSTWAPSWPGAELLALATACDVLTVHRDERWYNWRSGQAGVFAADTWATVRSQLRRRRTA